MALNKPWRHDLNADTRPLAYPSGRMVVDHLYRNPYAEVRLWFSDRGGHARRRLAAAQQLASIYRVQTRRVLDGPAAVHPDWLTVYGAPDDVARFAAALPAALAAIEAAATTYSRSIGSWVRGTTDGEDCAAGAGSLAALQRACRREFLRHLPLALCVALHPRTDTDDGQDDRYVPPPHDGVHAASAAAAAMAQHIAGWDDPAREAELHAHAAHMAPDGTVATPPRTTPTLPAPVPVTIRPAADPGYQPSLFGTAA
ncbi:hypothetical protein OG216_47540 (plasmid) [Streptomycetaceae bacterium NBC_01309]